MFEVYLSQPIIWFEKYFQNENFNNFTWIQDPFNTSTLSVEEDILWSYLATTI